jgi:hypothetical protein
METLNFDKYKFRCSSLGALMTESKATITDKQLKTLKSLQEKSATPKGVTNKQADEILRLIQKRDNPELSDTCKAELVKIYIHEKYGRTKEITSKYFEKGIVCEEDSITLIARLKKTMFFKNEARIQNEYLTGEPDLFEGDSIDKAEHVIDAKSCWDIFTFFTAKTKPLDRGYYFQLQGYGALTGAPKLSLAYCLVDTPESLVNEEKYRLLKRMDVLTSEDPAYLAAAAELEKNMTYPDIPIEERLQEFTFKRNEEVIKSIYARLDKCRIWLNEFAKKEAKILQPA